MGECVSKKEMLDILIERAEEYGRCMAVDKQSAVLGCMDAIRMMKPADVAPVVHARWEFVEDFGGDGHWMCTNCGVEWVFNDGRPEENEAYHCPRCGAKMDGHTTTAQRMAARLKVRCNHDT